MIRAITKAGLRFPTHLQKYNFGGHAAKAYDWRDDHSLNPYYEEDPRRRNIPDAYEYGQPFQSSPNPYECPFPDSYNPKDLTQNFVGTYPDK